MEGQALLDYVKRVMDLEKELFANQQIQDNFEKSSTQWKPAQPPKPRFESTDSPIPPVYDTSPWIANSILHDIPVPSQERIEKGFNTRNAVISALLAALGIAATIDGFRRGMDSDTIFSLGVIESMLGLVVALLAVCFLFMEIQFGIRAESVKGKYRHDVAIYKNELAKYNATIEQIKAENEEKQDQYRLALEDYQRRNSEYIQAREDSYALVTDSRRALEAALNSLYDMGIIYPKYRNLVAISAIYEYLSSGRCNRLDGPDGAYNLYEMELRQNIVIGQLSTIIANLNQIKNNQFTLYNELVSANQKSNLLLSDILNNVKISAYQNEAAAKNAEALKYISLIKR